nr:hypothetical protein [bacterium]
MNRIVGKLPLADGVTLFRIEAPEIARRRRAGQFVILRLDAEGERIPLTLVDSDPEAGSITLVVQAVGATTKRLAALREGEEIRDLAGPLGHPTPVRELGTVAVVALRAVDPAKTTKPSIVSRAVAEAPAVLKTNRGPPFAEDARGTARDLKTSKSNRGRTRHAWSRKASMSLRSASGRRWKSG